MHSKAYYRNVLTKDRKAPTLLIRLEVIFIDTEWSNFFQFLRKISEMVTQQKRTPKKASSPERDFFSNLLIWIVYILAVKKFWLNILWNTFEIVRTSRKKIIWSSSCSLLNHFINKRWFRWKRNVFKITLLW